MEHLLGHMDKRCFGRSSSWIITFDSFSEYPRENTIDFCGNKLLWLLVQRSFHGCIPQTGEDISFAPGQMQGLVLWLLRLIVLTLKTGTAFTVHISLLSSSLKRAGEKALSSHTYDHWTRTGQIFMVADLLVLGVFFFGLKCLKVLKVLLRSVRTLSNPYLWGSRAANTTPAGAMIEH